MMIKLNDIFPINALTDYKVHFAKWNQENQPLDVFTKDRQEWQGWQEYRPASDDFNRPLIFSIASFFLFIGDILQKFRFDCARNIFLFFFLNFNLTLAIMLFQSNFHNNSSIFRNKKNYNF